MAEQFFCLKKRNRNNLKQLIVYFISKFWHNNRGFQRQFILGLRSHICGAKTVSKETKQSYNRIKKLISYHDESSGSDGELELDTKEPYSILETWDKG